MRDAGTSGRSDPADTAEAPIGAEFEAFAPARPGSRRWTWIRIAASVALIALILWQAELGAVLDAMAGVDPRWIALALGLQLVGPAITALRWRGLLAARGVTPGWPYLWGSMLVSGFFRQFMPTIIGGDVIRGYDAWRAGATTGLAVMSLVLDRLFGLLALATLTFGGVLLSAEISARLPGIGFYVAAVFVVLVALIAQILLPSRLSLRLGAAGLARLPAMVRGRVAKIAEALVTYRDARGVLAQALALSFVLQLTVITFYWSIGRALGLPVDYASFFVIAPVAIFVMMLPISINGIGVREGVFVFLLGQWGVAPAEAVALAWIEYGIFLVFGLLGGGLYALRRR
ncbi:lysylphosphatidylglycerol synthase transmembrane domain-containing protein [uncultured Jannaschia sp.]|uniref:lysylphosphatidylglycerol synthase transmembrane domain-containing protein n=1 Tax=uncultured Jannaschia sp. TaxID=293347 RepID=UPI00261AB23B|nr:lysylphosphatidylglycerol synthase transmembrane domain-containing protein [uncultured Jannaschia sp.]